MEESHVPVPESRAFSISSSSAALFAALAKAQGHIKAAIKDRQNPHFKSSYADLASVWEACRDALAENGLAVLQPVANQPDGMVVVTTLLGHASGEWIKSELAAKPAQAGPQAMGSVITYLRRYGLAAMVGVAPDDDDDAEAAEERGRGQNARWSERALKESGPPPGWADTKPPPHQVGMATTRERDELHARAHGGKPQSAPVAENPHGTMPDPGSAEAIRLGKLYDRLSIAVMQREDEYDALENRWKAINAEVAKVAAQLGAEDREALKGQARAVQTELKRWRELALEHARQGAEAGGEGQ